MKKLAPQFCLGSMLYSLLLNTKSATFFLQRSSQNFKKFHRVLFLNAVSQTVSQSDSLVLGQPDSHYSIYSFILWLKVAEQPLEIGLVSPCGVFLFSFGRQCLEQDFVQQVQLGCQKNLQGQYAALNSSYLALIGCCYWENCQLNAIELSQLSGI